MSVAAAPDCRQILSTNSKIAWAFKISCEVNCHLTGSVRLGCCRSCSRDIYFWTTFASPSKAGICCKRYWRWCVIRSKNSIASVLAEDRLSWKRPQSARGLRYLLSSNTLRSCKSLQYWGTEFQLDRNTCSYVCAGASLYVGSLYQVRFVYFSKGSGKHPSFLHPQRPGPGDEDVGRLSGWDW